MIQFGVNADDDQQMKQLEAKVCELEEIRKHESSGSIYDI